MASRNRTVDTSGKKSLLPRGLRVSKIHGTEVAMAPPYIAAAHDAFADRLSIRMMSMEEFIETRGSGTLRKNRRIGMNTASHYLSERVAYEFGYGFEICPERFVTWGEARSEGDCHPLTEAGWHIERYASVCLFPGDEIECKYINVENDGIRREGVGIVVRKTSADWVPPGYLVFAIITEFDLLKGEFKEARNPC